MKMSSPDTRSEDYVAMQKADTLVQVLRANHTSLEATGESKDEMNVKYPN